MPTRRTPRKPNFAELTELVKDRLKPPFLIVLGSPREVVELVQNLPTSDITCFQLDLFQAQRLRGELIDGRLMADVVTAADLWDLPGKFQTVIFPVPLGGERSLKLDMVEQAYHVLAPGGTFVVFSPYDKDDLFADTLKKVFGKTHCPKNATNAVYWSQVGDEKKRRRHEVNFHVRVDETTSCNFISRPGTFSYGHFDFGARALIEAAEIRPGDRVADLGCGCGTNGILAARKAGPEGFVAFVDSNLRATALTELNARELGVPHFQTFATPNVEGLANDDFDVVLANPPYFAQLSIARMFIERGKRILKPGGRFYLVSKQIDAIHGMMTAAWGDCDIGELRGYYIFEATK